MDQNNIFAKLELGAVAKELRRVRPDLSAMQSAGILRDGNGRFTFEAPAPDGNGNFYYHCRAYNAYEARAKGWAAWLRAYEKTQSAS